MNNINKRVRSIGLSIDSFVLDVDSPDSIYDNNVDNGSYINIPTIDFSPMSAGSVHTTLYTRPMELKYNINFSFIHAFDGNASGTVKLKLDVWTLKDLDTLNRNSDLSITKTLNVYQGANTGKIIVENNLFTIEKGNIDIDTKLFIIKLTRQANLDTYTGTYKLINIIVSN